MEKQLNCHINNREHTFQSISKTNFGSCRLYTPPRYHPPLRLCFELCNPATLPGCIASSACTMFPENVDKINDFLMSIGFVFFYIIAKLCAPCCRCCFNASRQPHIKLCVQIGKQSATRLQPTNVTSSRDVRLITLITIWLCKCRFSIWHVEWKIFHFAFLFPFLSG
jgi:hypothetical protein